MVETRFKEHIDFDTVVFTALLGYLNDTGDPDRHDERDCRLTNMYPLVEVWAKGTYKKEEYDYTGEYEELCNQREETKTPKEKIKLDAKRLGIIVKIMDKSGFLPKRYGIYGLGTPDPSKIDEAFEDK